MDRVWSAGKDNDFWVEGRDRGQRGSAGDAKGEDREGADTASDEMGVLGTEV